MRYIELFAGIGGFRRGLEPLGHTCVGWVEMDKFARRSYMAIWPEAEKEWNALDITKVQADEIPSADLWCFGSPCQDLSVAGKRAGFAGTRSGLFLTVIRLLSEIKETDRPEWLLFENVEGILSSNRGWDFLVAQTEMAEVGYDTEYEIFNATDFGIPQSRKRLFLVGHLRSRGRRKVFPLRVDGRKNPAQLKELTHGAGDAYRVYDAQGVARTIKSEGGGLGAKTGLYQVGVVRKVDENGVETFSERDVALTIDANYFKGLDAHQARTGVKVINTDAWDHLPIVRAVLTPEREEKRQNGRRVKNAGEPMFTLTAQDRHGVMIQRSQSGTRQRNICGTLRTNQSSTDLTVYHQSRIRRLTPLECWRLMGREDWEHEAAKRAGVSDSQRYKQAGNSLIPQIVTEIARKMS
ncbi:MAG: DNA (cytosine-5-)-methyltransferase [Firmicutes bacterium]|nr:DNA (cytosine-5-)-methyltransferase [Bacillota bacterium]